MANEYLTVALLKDSLGITEDDKDVFIGRVVASASRAIDRHCKRRFWVNSSNETRYFTAGDPRELCGIDVVSVAALSTDPLQDRSYSEAWTTGDYELAPFNAALDSEPYTRVMVTPTGDFRFPTYSRGVKIVGKFGWPTVPDDVVTATEILASRYFNRSSATLGVLGFGADGVSVRIGREDGDVVSLLAPFVRNAAGSVRLG